MTAKKNKKGRGKKEAQNTASAYISVNQPALARKTLLLIAKESIEVEKNYQNFLRKLKERKSKEEELKNSVLEIEEELNSLLKSLPKPPSHKETKTSSKARKTTTHKRKPKPSSHLDALERQIKELEERIDSI